MMLITINGESLALPYKAITLGELANRRGISRKGTAIAVNGKMIKAVDWDTTDLHPADNLTVITAAYGG